MFVKVGAAAIIEHPALATWVTNPASIWLLKQINQIQLQPRVKKLTLEQCQFGGDAMKPTTLLVHALEDMEHTWVLQVILA